MLLWIGVLAVFLLAPGVLADESSSKAKFLEEIHKLLSYGVLIKLIDLS